MAEEQKKWSLDERYLLKSNVLKTATVHGRYRDGGGLYLQIDEKGRRWIFRYQLNGMRREMGLGSADIVTLADARGKADSARLLCQAGSDPVADKQKLKVASVIAPTFEELALTVYQHRQTQWKNGKHQAQWIGSLKAYAFPVIGKKPVNTIDTNDVLKVLQPIWSAKYETARRVKQRLEVVFEWAIVKNFRTNNPAQIVSPLLGNVKNNGKHHRALPYAEVSKFVTDLKSSSVGKVTKLSFELLILTVVRTTEVRGMMWTEVDFEKKLWTIPAERMKATKPHTVPLCQRVIEILKEAEGLWGNVGLVFKDEKTGRQLSENRFLNARDSIGYNASCTPHGFRSSFRDWASEETDFPSEVCEMALAHKINNKTEAAYRRGVLLEKRRQLMDAWNEYVLKAGVRNVLPMNSGA
jgi:integrase